MALFRPTADLADLAAPSVIIALDSWVDAGSAATAAAGAIAEDGRPLGDFDPDALFDYRARRPTLEIVDGRTAELTWPELVVRQARVADRDLVVITGAEPDYRWHELTAAMTELGTAIGAAEWITLGAIPAAVPHTRPVPVLGTASQPDLLRGGVQPGPSGTLRVPAACVSVIDHAVAAAGIPSVGYFAQVPHYVNGAYPPAAVELLTVLGRHLGLQLPLRGLPAEARQLRTRLDTAAALDDATRQYVERLETMVDESRLPSGDELISEIERFLREGGGQGQSQRPN
ncbi:MAG TPA: PAC2 family protein [Candidatus Limnocylindrales bacterium]|nr:PAC2 family protein [Candidatus Limnocylindrales bacterium]